MFIYLILNKGLRYDQLIDLCWLNLLPVAVSFIILVQSILVAFDIVPY